MSQATMGKQGINLGALRGFEAAARRLSFTGAAEEMRLTQGAVSRQIAGLERDLGAPLFRRLGRRLELTEAGADLLASVEMALSELDQAAERIRAPSSHKMTVSVLPTIGSVWLMPRLHKFTQAHPDIQVRIVTSIEPADFASADAHVAIRVGRMPGQNYGRLAPRIDIQMATKGADLRAQALFPDVLVPVISRELATTLADQELKDILEAVPLIHTTTRRRAWPDWLKAQGLSIAQRKRPVEHGHFFMALEEARASHGVALVPNAILPDLDYRRQLQILGSDLISSAGHYYALTSAARAADPPIAKFMAWISQEATDLRARLPMVDDQTNRPSPTAEASPPGF